MPKKEIDYSKSVIYKIVCKDLSISDFYVGSTSNFTKRKWAHKSACKRDSYPIYKAIQENGGWENWDMVMVEEYPCDNKLQCHQRERYWIESLHATLNVNIPSRTAKESNAAYYAENKDKFAEYYVEHKDKFLAYNAEYYAEHKDKYAEYYVENKDRIAAYQLANKDSITSYQAAYRKANKKNAAAYYAANKDKLLAYSAAYRASHKDKINKKPTICDDNAEHSDIIAE